MITLHRGLSRHCNETSKCMILNQPFVIWNSLHQHCIVSPFLLIFPSISCALLYSRTPHITTTVPRPDKNVTGFPNRRTDSHISRARFPVLATLQKVSFVIQNIWEKHGYKLYNIRAYGWKHCMRFLNLPVSYWGYEIH